MDIIATINAAYPNMTKAEKKAADYVLHEGDGHFFLHVTLDQLATNCHVGQASVMRMINACGYQSYRAFMLEVSQSKYRTSIGDQDSTRKSSADLANEWTNAIQACHESTDRQELISAAQALCQASFIICTGYGNSSLVASLAAIRLRRANLPAWQYVPGQIGYIADSSAAGPKAAALVFSISGETPEILSLAKDYVDKNLFVIAFTARTKSSLAKLANYTLYTPSQIADRKIGRLMDGIVSQLFAVEALAGEVERIKFSNKKEE